MSDPKLRVEATVAAAKAAQRTATPLERQLLLYSGFLQTLLFSAALRLFVWPHLALVAQGGPYLHYLHYAVWGARTAAGYLSSRLYLRLTGEERLGFLWQTFFGLLPSIIVDLALGGCYRGGCSLPLAVADGYCGHA
ncbi:hypothetical protein P885DRAFT_78387 [Corynascus similis CBS 632.67]